MSAIQPPTIQGRVGSIIRLLAQIAALGEDQEDQEDQEEGDEYDLQEFPGLPVTLSEEDQERIAELVAEKLAKRINDLLDHRPNSLKQ